MIDKVYGLLGISSKAGKTVSGTEVVEEGILKKNIKLVIIASDASERTATHIKELCQKNDIFCVVYGTIYDNSKSIGKINRAVIGIKDKNLAMEIRKVILGGEEIGKN